MSLFDDQKQNPDQFIQSQPKNVGSIQNFSEITAGAGEEVFRVGKEGIWAGASTYADAPFKISWEGHLEATDVSLPATSAIAIGKTGYADDTAGFWVGDVTGTKKLYLGTASKYLKWDGAALTIRGTLNADDITAGTLSGITVQSNSATTGAAVKMTTGNLLGFYFDNVLRSAFSANSNGDSLWDASGGVYVVADDEMAFFYNDNGGSDSCVWIEDSGAAMSIDSSKDLNVANDVYADNYFDYAEFFESTEEYKEGIPVGTTVVLEGDKVKPAKQGETPIGSVSGSAAIILNAGSSDAGKSWGKKYLTDDFGRKIYEEVEKWYLPKNEKNSGKTRKGLVSDGKVPKGAIIKKRPVQKINPAWDQTKEFIPRKKRPEWNKIGLVGRVRLRKGQPVAPNWIKLKDVSEEVEEWLIR